MANEQVNILQVQISSIGPWSKNRRIWEENVKNLEISIAQVGLMQPITLRLWPSEEAGAYEYQLIAGGHRFEACKRLGATTIAARCIEADDYKAALLSVDENCIRAEPSAIERALAFGSLREAYDAKHGHDVSPGVAGGKARQQIESVESFAVITGRAVSLSDKTIRRDLQFFATFGRQSLEKIVRTTLDSFSELTALKELDVDKRRSLFEQAARGVNISAKPDAQALRTAKVMEAALDAANAVAVAVEDAESEDTRDVDPADADVIGDGTRVLRGSGAGFAVITDTTEHLQNAALVGEVMFSHDKQPVPPPALDDENSDIDILFQVPDMQAPEATYLLGQQYEVSGVIARALELPGKITNEPFAGQASVAADRELLTIAHYNEAFENFVSAARQRLNQLSIASHLGYDEVLIEFVDRFFENFDFLELGGVLAEAYVDHLSRTIDFDEVLESVNRDLDEAALEFSSGRTATKQTPMVNLPGS